MTCVLDPTVTERIRFLFLHHEARVTAGFSEAMNWPFPEETPQG
jgi:hypothetical protein